MSDHVVTLPVGERILLERILNDVETILESKNGKALGFQLTIPETLDFRSLKFKVYQAFRKRSA